MKTNLLLIPLLVGLLGYSVSAQVQQAWVARYNNGLLNGTNQAVKMVLDSSGSIYITGFSQNTNGNLGYATVKYAATGAQMWATRYDSTNYPSATPVGLALDNSNNVIVSGSAVTVKYDTNGNQLWTAPYSATALATDAGGNVYITGFGTNFNTEKLSPGGSNIWGTAYGGGPSLSQFILVDKQSNMYVGGSDTYGVEKHGGVIVGYDYQLAVVKYDVNGNQQWVGRYSVVSSGSPQAAGAALDSANNVFVVANWYSQPFQTTMFSNNGVLGWVAYDPTGDGFSLAHSLSLDKANNVALTGKNANYYPQSQYGTYKINTNGAYIWANLYPNVPTTLNVGTAVTVDQANNIYVTGFSPGTNTGNDIVTIKYDNNGNQLWVQRYNGPGNGDDEANAVAVDALGNVYVTGYETTAAGGTEMVTIKYAPSPTGGKQTNGAFLLQTQGEPGETFDIQATTNFKSWLDLGLTNADTNGLLQFLDTNAPSFNQRFYITKPQ